MAITEAHELQPSATRTLCDAVAGSLQRRAVCKPLAMPSRA